MQQLVKLGLRPQEYIDQNHHQGVPGPDVCIRCGKSGSYWALGYYSRYVNEPSLNSVLMILVRRFRCTICNLTVSMLPDFCQPYRLLSSDTIESYVKGDDTSLDILSYENLLKKYMKDFAHFLPQLRQEIGNGLGRAPPDLAPGHWWLFLLGACEGLRTTTRVLTKTFRISLFKIYRCHQCCQKHS